MLYQINIRKTDVDDKLYSQADWAANAPNLNCGMPLSVVNNEYPGGKVQYVHDELRLECRYQLFAHDDYRYSNIAIIDMCDGCTGLQLGPAAWVKVSMNATSFDGTWLRYD